MTLLLCCAECGVEGAGPRLQVVYRERLGESGADAGDRVAAASSIWRAAALSGRLAVGGVVPGVAALGPRRGGFPVDLEALYDPDDECFGVVEDAEQDVDQVEGGAAMPAGVLLGDGQRGAGAFGQAGTARLLRPDLSGSGCAGAGRIAAGPPVC